MGLKIFSSFPLNEKFSGFSGLSGLVPNYVYIYINTTYIYSYIYIKQKMPGMENR